MDVITKAITRDFPRHTRVVIKERYTDYAKQCSLSKFTIAYTTGKVGLYVRLTGYSVHIGHGVEIITGDGIRTVVPADCLKNIDKSIEEKKRESSIALPGGIRP